MTIENSPCATSAAPVRSRPGVPMPTRPAAIQPVAILAATDDHGDCGRYSGDARDEPSVHLQAEEYEEHCGEEVAQRQQQPSGMGDDVA